LDMNAGILEVANLVVEPRYQSKVLWISTPLTPSWHLLRE